jgi:hypothetical protein
MLRYPAVVVHGLTDARTVLAEGVPVTVISAPGATLYAGCLWWREMIALARRDYPSTPAVDVLDCADGSGQALAALRIGQQLIVLAFDAPGWAEVAAIAAERGGAVLAARPPALDLAVRGAGRCLPDWLRGGLSSRTDDTYKRAGGHGLTPSPDGVPPS